VIFTDEWGGGTQARCRETDQMNWGSDAIFDVVDGKLRFASYYKLPVPQTLQENCVSHNASIVPVPGRDILVQAWYQGGISLLDFTDSAHPREIGFFDRGPVSGTGLVIGGFWSSYWYNGHIYASELARGFDVFGLKASEHLTEAEVAAAREVRQTEFNAQHQAKIAWAPSFAVARARFDQLVRTCTSTVSGQRVGSVVVTGVTCLNGATIIGPVVVRPGASLLVIDSSITGAVTASSASAVHLYHSRVKGIVSVIGTAGSTAVVDTTVTGALVLANTDTPGIEPIVADSTVKGVLACTGNAPAPINLSAPNSVIGVAIGQCATLD
jgi:hypothetical protein